MPFQYPRYQEVGDDSTEVDGKIKYIKYFGYEVLILDPELISDVGRDTWFDTTCSQCY